MSRSLSFAFIALSGALTFGLISGCSSRSEVTYGACQASAVCAEDTRRCVAFTNRVTGLRVPLCTVACNTDVDCPDQGVCITAEDENRSRFCVQRCASAGECRFANAICPLVRGDAGGCLP
ncbi:MAG: hypothetical protein JNK72_00855 [Myxococcales bacterium]|nr:hypothetical protein [Myxococcales bacterium]